MSTTDLHGFNYIHKNFGVKSWREISTGEVREQKWLNITGVNGMEKRKLLTLPEIELRFLGHRGRSLALCRLTSSLFVNITYSDTRDNSMTKNGTVP
jgi:hypothetical protein